MRFSSAALAVAGLPTLPPRPLAWALLYFAAIGAGFMFIQIACVQRFSVFLGHPTYTLAVIPLVARPDWTAALEGGLERGLRGWRLLVLPMALGHSLDKQSTAALFAAVALLRGGEPFGDKSHSVATRRMTEWLRAHAYKRAQLEVEPQPVKVGLRQSGVIRDIRIRVLDILLREPFLVVLEEILQECLAMAGVLRAEPDRLISLLSQRPAVLSELCLCHSQRLVLHHVR